MASLENAAFLALLLSTAFGVANAIRPLKGGPMMGPDGREYKLAPLKHEDIAAEKVEGLPSSGASTVSVQCTEKNMIILIKADLFKNGYRVSPSELFLGPTVHSGHTQNCRAIAVKEDEYVIEAGLHDCGSKLTIFGDSMIYSNKVVFSPVAGSYRGITRTANAVIPISCHYQSTQFVSTNGREAPLSISTSTKYSEESGFFLKLMTDDWKRERSSNVFYLGDMLHLEATYSDPASVSRQLFIDTCVATLEPDATSVPRYYFIENHGCFTDAKEKRSKAQFQSRMRSDTLQLQLDAFLFKQDPRNSIFITCQLKATTEIWMSSPTNKACNFEHSRWKNEDGNDHVCRCCETGCYRSSPKWNRKTSQQRRVISEDTMVCGIVTFGPMMIFSRK